MEKRLRDALAICDEANKENSKNSDASIVEKNSLVDESLPASVKPDEHTAELIEKAKTAEDFIEIFEKVFHNSDEMVQLIKRIGKASTESQRQIYTTQVLEKSRTLREIINEVLIIFRKARINPSVSFTQIFNLVFLDVGSGHDFASSRRVEANLQHVEGSEKQYEKA